MAITERLALIIDADGKGAVRELEKVGKTAEREVGRAESSLDKWGSKMTSVGATMMAGAAVVGVALWDAASATSDLNEAADYSARVFGGASAEVEAFAKSAESIGLSERAAYEAATTFGDLLKATKASKSEVAGMSVEMAQLASDMASAKNTSPEDAVQALGAALRGESEPIRRYGVMLDEATLKQRALDMGLIKTTSGTLPQSIKMQAAYAEVMAQTAGMQGNFAETADGAANKQRQMAATIENAKAQLGEGFLPVMSQVIGVMGSAAAGMSSFNEATGGAVSQLLATGTVVTGVGGALAFAGGKAMALRASLIASAEAGSAAAATTLAAFGPVVAMFAALGGVYLAYQLQVNEADGAMQSMIDTAKEASSEGGFEDFIRKNDELVRQHNQMVDESSKGLDFWDNSYAQAMADATYETGPLIEAQQRQIAITRELASATGESLDSALDWVRAQEESGTILKDSEQALAMYEAQMQASGVSAESATLRQAELNKTYDDAQSDLDKLISKVSAYYDVLDGTLDPQVQWETALDEFTATVGENGLAWDSMRDRLDITTEAGRANLEVLRQQRDAAVAQGEAVLRSGGSTEEATAKTMEHVEALRAQWAAAGYSTAQIDSMIAMLGLTPAQVTTAISQPGMDEALGKTAHLKWLMDSMSREVMTTVGITTIDAGGFIAAGIAGRRNAGGPVEAGRPYLVGDGGVPEVFVPSQPGTVVTPQQAAASVGGGPTGGDVYLDGNKVGKWLARSLPGDQRSRTGWQGVGS